MKWLNSAESVPAPSDTKNKVLEKNKDIQLSDNSRTILEKRYIRKNKDGTPAETIEEMFGRIAKAIAEPDKEYGNVKTTEIEFYNMLTTKKFFPNSPTFTGAGTPLGQLSACFVLPIEDDLGRHQEGIFSTLRNAALIQQTGGGNGFSFSRLRAKGAFVSKSGGKASGPIGFLKVYDTAFGEVAQGGTRRGANMAVLRVDHPDIREFIKCKSDEGSVSNFNISIALTDTFMRAVEDDTTYELIEPNTKEVLDTPKAREIFDLIVQYAYKNGEPGVLFIDSANKDNPVPHLYEIEATNPCAEQFLGPFENCCLGSINLAQHITEEGMLDWVALEETIKTSTRFLDNVVTANKYVPEIPQLREAAMNVRRIGLGFMGLSDVMYSMGVRYGSSKSFEFAAKIMEFIRYHSMLTSIELAKERGAFPAIEGSIYDQNDLKWEIPSPIKEYIYDFGRPPVSWENVYNGIKEHGIRNGAQTTVAPTGTISTVAGVEGYGCEPVFALVYMRNVYQAAMDEDGLTLTYTSPLFSKALDACDLNEDQKKAIIDEIIETGSCQDITLLPDEVKNAFVVSSDIKPDEHIMMQASIQAFVDNSISKTCNLPATATADDVAQVYKEGWKLGCKGLTIYVTGSRDEVVLETKATKDAKRIEGGFDDEGAPTVSNPVKRGYKLSGNSYKVHTPQGKAYVTINKNSQGYPVELFMNVGKAGSDIAALSEALGRALSGWLQTSVNPLQTVKEIVAQLIGIGGHKSVGFGKNRISSIPDAVAKVLTDEFDLNVEVNGETHVSQNVPAVEEKEENTMQITQGIFSMADMCPECGNYAFIREEGCQKCYSCNHSIC